MKKLLLASSGLTYIKEFVGVQPRTLNMLFIPTAGNLDKDTWWIDKDRDVLAKMGFRLQELTIENTPQQVLRAALRNADIVYVAGGNTFYLLKQLQQTGFGDLLIDFVENGGLYAGASAGALVAGADIQPIAALDEPEKVQHLDSTKGLALVNLVPIPHCDPQDTKPEPAAIKEKYGKEFEIVLLTDDQAIVVEGESYRVVDSPRSTLEMEWLNTSSSA